MLRASFTRFFFRGINMANNERISLNFDDIDGFSFDNDFGKLDLPDVPESRTPYQDMKSGLARGFKDQMLNSTTLWKMIDAIAPKGYSTALHTIRDVFNTGKSMYTQSVETLRPQITEFQRNAKRLRTMYADKLPDGVRRLVDKKLDEVAPRERRYDAEADTLSSSMREIFEAQQTVDDSRYADERAREIAQQAVDEKRFKTELQQLAGIRSSLDRIVSYQDQIMIKRDRKLIELNYQQLFAMTRLVNLTKESSQEMILNLKGIVHNTALPDQVKINTMEVSKGMMRQGMIRKAHKSVSDYTSGFTQQLQENVQRKIKSITQGINSGLMSANMSLGMMDPSMADDLNISEGIGGAAGSFIADELTNLIGDEFGRDIARQFNKIPGAQRVNQQLMYLANNAPELLNQWSKKRSNGFRWKFWKKATDLDKITGQGYMGADLINGIKSLVPKFNASAQDHTSTLFGNGREAVSYDQMSRKTLVEIIPELLGQIAQNTETMATGKPAERRRYNAAYGVFTTDKESQKIVGKKLANNSDITYINNMVDYTIGSIDPDGNGLSKQAKLALRTQLIDDMLRGKNFSPRDMMTDTYYSKVTDPKLRTELSTYFGSKFSGTNEYGISSDTNVQRHINRVLNDYQATRSMLPDVEKTVQGFIDSGDSDLLRRMGILSRDKGREYFNTDYLLNRITGGVTDGEFDDEIDDPETEEERDQNARDKARRRARRRRNKRLRNGVTNGIARGRDAVTGSQIYRRGKQAINNVDLDELKNKASDIASSLGDQVKQAGESVQDTVRENTPSPDAIRGIKDQLGNTLEARLFVDQYKNTAAIEAVIDRYKDLEPDAKLKAVAKDLGSRAESTLSDIRSKLRGREINKKYNDASAFVKGKLRQQANALRGLANVTNVSPKEKVDIYVGDETEPRITRHGIISGEYINTQTEKPIRNIGDITANIVDREGNTVLAAEDIDKGLKDKDGNRLRFIENNFVGLAVRLARIGWSLAKFAKRSAGKILSGSRLNMAERRSADIYVYGRPEPILTKAKMDAGEYRDYKTGKLIQTINDIRGPVVDKEGNLVLTSEDYTNGIRLKDGTNITRSGFMFRTGQFMNWYFGGYYRNLWKFTKWSVNRSISTANKILDWARKVTDVYVEGENQPRLLAKDLRQGMYVSARTGKRIYSVADIDGPVMDFNGEIVLTEEHLQRGLYTNTGKKLSLGPRAVKRLGIMAGKAVGWTLKQTGLTANNLAGASNWMIDKLTGNRYGSWQQQRKERKEKEERERREKIGKGEKVKKEPSWWQKPFIMLAGVIGAGVKKVVEFLSPLKYLKTGFKMLSDAILKSRLVSGGLDLLGKGKRGLGGLVRRGASAVFGRAGWIARGATALAGTSLGSSVIAGASAVGSGLMTGLGAIGAAIASPLGLAALGVGALAVGGYFVWKKFFKKPDPMQALRLAEYGINLDDRDTYSKVLALEETAAKHLNNTPGMRINFKPSFPVKEAYKLFEVDTADIDAVNTFNQWLFKRFRVVYLHWAGIMNSIQPGVPVHLADDKLEDKNKLPVAKQSKISKEARDYPYNVTAYPRTEGRAVTGEKVIDDCIQVIEEKFGRAASAAARIGLNETKLRENAKIAAKGLKPKDKNVVYADVTDLDKIKGDLERGVGNVNKAMFENAKRNSVDELLSIRMKAYGLVDLVKDNVDLLLEMEEHYAKLTTFNGDGQAQLEFIPTQEAKVWGPRFGFTVSLDTQTRTNEWAQWFRKRFTRVFLAFMSGLRMADPNVVPAKANSLSATLKSKIAEAIIGAKVDDSRWAPSIWTTKHNPWGPEFVMNTDSESTTESLQSLRARITSEMVEELRKALDPDGSKTQDKAQLARKEREAKVKAAADRAAANSGPFENDPNDPGGSLTKALGKIGGMFGGNNADNASSQDNKPGEISTATGGSDPGPMKAGPGTEAGQLGILAKIKKYGITNPTEIAMILAQTHEETGGYQRVEENLNYKPNRLMQVWPGRFPSLALAQQVASKGKVGIANYVYGNRKDLGNTQPGDGFKFRGRGYIQLTGRSNYQDLKTHTGIDAVNDPDQLTTPDGAAESSLFYWTKTGNIGGLLRKRAQAGDVTGVTKIVNGGYTNLGVRQKLFKQYQKLVQSDWLQKMMGKVDGSGGEGSAADNETENTVTGNSVDTGAEINNAQSAAQVATTGAGAGFDSSQLSQTTAPVSGNDGNQFSAATKDTPAGAIQDFRAGLPNNGKDEVVNQGLKTVNTMEKAVGRRTDNYSGITLKSDEAVAGGPSHPGLVLLAKYIQDRVPNFRYFSALNDAYHQRKGGTSLHRSGLALDFTMTVGASGVPAAMQALAGIFNEAKMQKGEYFILNEYKVKTKNTTGGHIHVDLRNDNSAAKFLRNMTNGVTTNNLTPDSETENSLAGGVTDVDKAVDQANKTNSQNISNGVQGGFYGNDTPNNGQTRGVGMDSNSPNSVQQIANNRRTETPISSAELETIGKAQLAEQQQINATLQEILKEVRGQRQNVEQPSRVSNSGEAPVRSGGVVPMRKSANG